MEMTDIRDDVHFGNVKPFRGHFPHDWKANAKGLKSQRRIISWMNHIYAQKKKHLLVEENNEEKGKKKEKTIIIK